MYIQILAVLLIHSLYSANEWNKRWNGNENGNINGLPNLWIRIKTILGKLLIDQKINIRNFWWIRKVRHGLIPEHDEKMEWPKTIQYIIYIVYICVFEKWGGKYLSMIVGGRLLTFQWNKRMNEFYLDRIRNHQTISLISLCTMFIGKIWYGCEFGSHQIGTWSSFVIKRWIQSIGHTMASTMYIWRRISFKYKGFVSSPVSYSLGNAKYELHWKRVLLFFRWKITNYLIS